MGLWDDVKKAGRLYSDVVGDSHFSFRCPNCSRVCAMGGNLLTPKSQAEAMYKANPLLICPRCNYEFGVDPYRGYARCTCGSLNTLVDGFVGAYECQCGKDFAIQRHDSSEVYFGCFKGKQRGVHLCSYVCRIEKSVLQNVARDRGKISGGCPLAIDLPINEVLKFQLPNYADRTETAVLPQIAIHDLQRQGERQLRAQLESFVPARSSGRKITYRRITIDSNGIIAEELIIE